MGKYKKLSLIEQPGNSGPNNFIKPVFHIQINNGKVVRTQTQSKNNLEIKDDKNGSKTIQSTNPVQASSNASSNPIIIQAKETGQTPKTQITKTKSTPQTSTQAINTSFTDENNSNPQPPPSPPPLPVQASPSVQIPTFNDAQSASPTPAVQIPTNSNNSNTSQMDVDDGENTRIETNETSNNPPPPPDNPPTPVVRDNIAENELPSYKPGTSSIALNRSEQDQNLISGSLNKLAKVHQRTNNPFDTTSYRDFSMRQDDSDESIDNGFTQDFARMQNETVVNNNTTKVKQFNKPPRFSSDNDVNDDVVTSIDNLPSKESYSKTKEIIQDAEPELLPNPNPNVNINKDTETSFPSIHVVGEPSLPLNPNPNSIIAPSKINIRQFWEEKATKPSTSKILDKSSMLHNVGRTITRSSTPNRHKPINKVHFDLSSIHTPDEVQNQTDSTRVTNHLLPNQSNALQETGQNDSTKAVSHILPNQTEQNDTTRAASHLLPNQSTLEQQNESTKAASYLLPNQSEDIATGSNASENSLQQDATGSNTSVNTTLLDPVQPDSLTRSDTTEPNAIPIDTALSHSPIENEVTTQSDQLDTLSRSDSTKLKPISIDTALSHSPLDTNTISSLNDSSESDESTDSSFDSVKKKKLHETFDYINDFIESHPDSDYPPELVRYLDEVSNVSTKLSEHASSITDDDDNDPSEKTLLDKIRLFQPQKYFGKRKTNQLSDTFFDSENEPNDKIQKQKHTYLPRGRKRSVQEVDGTIVDDFIPKKQKIKTDIYSDALYKGALAAQRAIERQLNQSKESIFNSTNSTNATLNSSK